MAFRLGQFKLNAYRSDEYLKDLAWKHRRKGPGVLMEISVGSQLSKDTLLKKRIKPFKLHPR